jgi:hypothetical protein
MSYGFHKMIFKHIKKYLVIKNFMTIIYILNFAQTKISKQNKHGLKKERNR